MQKGTILRMYQVVMFNNNNNNKIANNDRKWLNKLMFLIWWNYMLLLKVMFWKTYFGDQG